MKLKEIIAADFQAATYSKRPAGWLDMLKLYLTSYSFRIVFRFRVALRLKAGNRLTRGIALLLYWKNMRRGVDISLKSSVGPGLRIPHPLGITIGEDVVIGSFAHILPNVTLGGNSGRKNFLNGRERTMPTLGDFVRVGAGAVIAGPITLGSYVQVAANAVVIESVPDFATVAGVPGKILVYADAPHELGLAGVVHLGRCE